MEDYAQEVSRAAALTARDARRFAAGVCFSEAASRWQCIEESAGHDGQAGIGRCFLQDPGGKVPDLLDWMLSAWGWTVSVAAAARWSWRWCWARWSASCARCPTAPGWCASATAWVELFRNIPLLVQIFLWYHVMPALFPPMAGVPQLRAGGAGAGLLHLGAHRRAGARRHPGAAAGPALRRHGGGLHHAAVLPLRDAADGLPHHHAAAHQRVDEHLQELVGGVRGVDHRADVVRACRPAKKPRAASRSTWR